MIHASAIIDKSAKLDKDVSIGPYSVIGADVEIKSGSVIGSHALIEGPTSIGKHNKIFSFATIGGDPQDKKYDGDFMSWSSDGNSLMWTRGKHHYEKSLKAIIEKKSKLTKNNISC